MGLTLRKPLAKWLDVPTDYLHSFQILASAKYKSKYIGILIHWYLSYTTTHRPRYRAPKYSNNSKAEISSLAILQITEGINHIIWANWYTKLRNCLAFIGDCWSLNGNLCFLRTQLLTAAQLWIARGNLAQRIYYMKWKMLTWFHMCIHHR